MAFFLKRLERWMEVRSFERDYGEQVRAAGLFDDQFYQEHLGGRKIKSLLRHYLLEGWRANLSPHPRITSSDIATQWGYYGWVESISPLEGYWKTGRFFGLDFTGSDYKKNLKTQLAPVVWPEQRANKAVVVHAFYVEESKLILEALLGISELVDVIVTTPHEVEVIQGVVNSAGISAQVIKTPNIGRDIFPFIYLIENGLLERYSFVGKLHSKRSLHRADAKQWLKNCINCVIKYASNNEMLETQGLVAPMGTLTKNHNFYANALRIQWLCAKLGFMFAEQDLVFAEGSMFWARSAALKSVKDAKLDIRDFQGECGQLDGTLAHALERFFGISCIKNGFEIVEDN